ncbi:hypothetical protein BEWA_048160 [Theileria equi strain WA]|uniref:Uncharacterized protein n=1 Tax=Theileria equi strain WA TaxID=1537102 RepID=L1LAS0_THEEQ|nr:hypothetical protein BEWA_048160 [Theileria equi strain WA]EKX72349.1 hypothetical protein BEWA_048160 [Theileria equi strain WA]|eukprot:XP_004831801.1 hypothetical protein BEWA_048160 [Theileria equi strain WA]
MNSRNNLNGEPAPQPQIWQNGGLTLLRREVPHLFDVPIRLCRIVLTIFLSDSDEDEDSTPQDDSNGRTLGDMRGSSGTIGSPVSASASAPTLENEGPTLSTSQVHPGNNGDHYLRVRGNDELLHSNDAESTDEEDEFFLASETFDDDSDDDQYTLANETNEELDSLYDIGNSISEEYDAVIRELELGFEASLLAEALADIPDNSELQLTIEFEYPDIVNFLNDISDDEDIEVEVVSDTFQQDPFENYTSTLPTPVENPVTLELSNPNEREINLLKGEYNGIHEKEYTPIGERNIVSIRENCRCIWNGALGEACQRVILYKRDRDVLICLELTTPNGSEKRFLEKQNLGFMRISESEFRTKLDEMRNQPRETTEAEHPNPEPIAEESVVSTSTAEEASTSEQA